MQVEVTLDQCTGVVDQVLVARREDVCDDFDELIDVAVSASQPVSPLTTTSPAR
ncbi:hypothetical protein [Corynebacterium halotolerans]|uniref:hypothetical protein n=1 Tax=Corynebacterium halotolerans TaxID=225326 RepID=UPI001375E205|nr:hypothetical protein [Corynebacterium halotolerans]